MEDRRFGTATLATAGGQRIRVIRGLEPAWFGAAAGGAAVTVRGPGGDNLAIHHGLAAAGPGQMLVADFERNADVGHWGELMSIAARARGIEGLVVNAAVRDRALLAEVGFPVFHLGVTPGQSVKTRPGEVGVPVQIQGELVEPGDWIAADDDGVVVVPAAEIARVFSRARELEERDEARAKRLVAGESTFDVMEL